MVTAEPVLPRLVLSDSQVGILQSIVRKTRCPQAIALRARAVLAAARGLNPSDAARELGCVRLVARRWPERFAQAQRQWGEAADQWSEKVLTDKVLDVLEDCERSGAPATFTPEQMCQIMAVAVERPEECGRPISHWGARELADEVIKRGIVPTISPRHVGRFLKKSTSSRTRCVTG
jgi:putative transposase